MMENLLHEYEWMINGVKPRNDKENPVINP